MNNYITSISIAINHIYDYIYAQSAWYAVYHKDIKALTRDNERIIDKKIYEGFRDFCHKFSGYLTYHSDVNLPILRVDFKFKHNPSFAMVDVMQECIIALLGNFVLMKFYGENDFKGLEYGKSIFYIEWRRYTSKLMVSFAKDEI